MISIAVALASQRVTYYQTGFSCFTNGRTPRVVASLKLQQDITIMFCNLSIRLSPKASSLEWLDVVMIDHWQS